MIDDSNELDQYLEDFGTVAVINQNEITVIFDDDFATFTEFEAEGRSITATLKTSEMQGIQRNDTVIINNKPYKIKAIHPAQDGKFTELILGE